MGDHSGGTTTPVQPDEPVLIPLPSVRRRRFVVIAYVVIVLAISFFASVAVVSLDPTDVAAAIAIYVCVAFSPALVAVLLQRAVLKERFRKGEFSMRTHRWSYFLVAALLFPLLQFLAFRFGEIFANQYVLEPINWFALDIELVLLSLFVMGEEVGWRSFLQPRVSPGRPLLAALVTGVIWGAWHLPTWYLEPHYPGIVRWMTGYYLIMLVPSSVILAFLRERTGTVWAAAIAHGSYNVVAYLELLVTDLVMYTYYGAIIVVALVILLTKRLRELEYPGLPTKKRERQFFETQAAHGQ